MVTYFKDGVDEVMGEGVDILFCNQEEAMTYSGADSLEAAVAVLQKKAQKLVVTLGSDGALVINADGSRTNIPTQPVKALDTNGAGDMFAGAFLYGVTQGMSDEQAGKLANNAAAKVVSVFGARLSKDDHQAALTEVMSAA